MSDEHVYRKPFPNQRKRRTRSPKFLKPNKRSSHGINVRRYFIKGSLHSAFDENLQKKPTILHWFEKARKQLLDKYQVPDERDFIMKFMDWVRSKFWFRPSEYQLDLYRTIYENAPQRLKGEQ